MRQFSIVRNLKPLSYLQVDQLNSFKAKILNISEIVHFSSYALNLYFSEYLKQAGFDKSSYIFHYKFYYRKISQ